MLCLSFCPLSCPFSNSMLNSVQEMWWMSSVLYFQSFRAKPFHMIRSNRLKCKSDNSSKLNSKVISRNLGVFTPKVSTTRVWVIVYFKMKWIQFDTEFNPSLSIIIIKFIHHSSLSKHEDFGWIKWNVHNLKLNGLKKLILEYQRSDFKYFCSERFSLFL